MSEFPTDINVGELWKINYDVWLLNQGRCGYLIVTDIVAADPDMFLVCYHFFDPPEGWSEKGYDFYDDFKMFYEVISKVNKK